MSNASLWTRRQFIHRSSALVLGGAGVAGLAPGCAHSALVRDALDVAAGVIGYIPAFGSASLAALFKAIAALIGSDRAFSPGETLRSPGSASSVVEVRSGDGIPSAFERAGSAFRTMQTPIVAATRGTTRYVQLESQQGLYHLVRGFDGSAHKIHAMWLEWMLFKDHCDLQVDGATSFEPCGINGCPIQVARQPFRAPNRRAHELMLIVDTEYELYARSVRDEHSEHAEKWKDCPTTPIEKADVECSDIKGVL